MDEIITLDYGSGGKKTSRLIENEVLPRLGNPALGELGDGAVLRGEGELVFSTDSFDVSPLFFPGGDIGKLAVCGTVNDIAMCGGEARYLSPRADNRRGAGALPRSRACWTPCSARRRRRAYRSSPVTPRWWSAAGGDGLYITRPASASCAARG